MTRTPEVGGSVKAKDGLSPRDRTKDIEDFVRETKLEKPKLDDVMDLSGTEHDDFNVANTEEHTVTHHIGLGRSSHRHRRRHREHAKPKRRDLIPMEPTTIIPLSELCDNALFMVGMMVSILTAIFAVCAVIATTYHPHLV